LKYPTIVQEAELQESTVNIIPNDYYPQIARYMVVGSEERRLWKDLLGIRKNRHISKVPHNGWNLHL
jgi:hypothetical protein